MKLLDAIQSRRSINFFEKGKKIPEDTLKKLIELAALTPSSMNTQPWRVIAVVSDEGKKILRKCAFNQIKVEEASAVLIIVADPYILEHNVDAVMDSSIECGYMKEKNRESTKKMALNLYGDKDSEKRRIYTVKNSSMFAMSIMLAAKGLGLETHPMDGFDEKMVKENFDIPDRVIIPMLIAVGNLRECVKLLPRAMRFSHNDILSKDSFNQEWK